MIVGIHVFCHFYEILKFIISTVEVMFSLALVCLLAGLCKNYSTDLIWCRGGTWTSEETIRHQW